MFLFVWRESYVSIHSVKTSLTDQCVKAIMIHKVLLYIKRVIIMSKLTYCSVLLLVTVVHSAITAIKLLNVVSIPGNEVCPLQEKRGEAIQTIRATIKQNLEISLNCGSG